MTDSDCLGVTMLAAMSSYLVNLVDQVRLTASQIHGNIDSLRTIHLDAIVNVFDSILLAISSMGCVAIWFPNKGYSCLENR